MCWIGWIARMSACSAQLHEGGPRAAPKLSGCARCQWRVEPTPCSIAWTAADGISSGWGHEFPVVSACFDGHRICGRPARRAGSAQMSPAWLTRSFASAIGDSIGAHPTSQRIATRSARMGRRATTVPQPTPHRQSPQQFMTAERSQCDRTVDFVYMVSVRSALRGMILTRDLGPRPAPRDRAARRARPRCDPRRSP